MLVKVFHGHFGLFYAICYFISIFVHFPHFGLLHKEKPEAHS
jgi:hypothetical protein